MDGKQKINQLFSELEQLARSLKESTEVPKRRELFSDMRFVLDEADRLILPKYGSANS